MQNNKINSYIFTKYSTENHGGCKYSDFRKNIKSYLDRVSKNFETLVINRGKEAGIVVISLQEYNSLMATNHEMSSRKNELRLDSAIQKILNLSQKI